MTDDHHAHDVTDVALAVLTITSSRTADTDASGDAIAGALEGTEASIVHRGIVDDDETAIREAVQRVGGREDVDAVVTTGGTGLTPDDVTVEAVRPLFDREIPGFGEQFRARSVEEVGPKGMLTRATAGVAGDVPVFCLPGSENAARLGTAELIAPTVGHILGLVRGGGQGHSHDHDEGDHSHGEHTGGDGQ